MGEDVLERDADDRPAFALIFLTEGVLGHAHLRVGIAVERRNRPGLGKPSYEAMVHRQW